MQRQLQLKKENGRSVSTSDLAFRPCPCFARYPVHLKTCIHVLRMCDTVQPESYTTMGTLSLHIIATQVSCA